MSFVSGFKSLPRLVQIILLLIPGVNWVTEVVVRVSAFLHGKGMEQVIFLVLAVLPTSILLGWADLISCLLFKKLILI